MTLDNIIGIFIQPYIGHLSDHTRTRLGRRLPYILVGTPVAAVFFAAIPIIYATLPHERAGIGLVLLMGAIIIMNIAMAIFRTPVVALMPDITPPEQRSKANGIINLMGGIGTTIAFGLGGIFAINAGLPFWIGAVVLLGAEAIVLLTIREPSAFTTAAGEATRSPSLRESLADLGRTLAEVLRVKDKSALYICLAIFSWFMGYNAIEAFWSLYGRYHLCGHHGARRRRRQSREHADLAFWCLSTLCPALRFPCHPPGPQTHHHGWLGHAHRAVDGHLLHPQPDLRLCDAAPFGRGLGTHQHQLLAHRSRPGL
jgi:Na+/melibiose symporter-like transporter